MSTIGLYIVQGFYIVKILVRSILSVINMSSERFLFPLECVKICLHFSALHILSKCTEFTY